MTAAATAVTNNAYTAVSEFDSEMMGKYFYTRSSPAIQ